MASHSETPIGNTDTINDTSEFGEPQVQQNTITTGEKEAVATDHKFAGREAEQDTESMSDGTSPKPVEEEGGPPEELDSSTSATDDSPEIAGPWTPSNSDDDTESVNSAVHDEALAGFDDASISHTAIGEEVQSHTQTHQTISPHISQILGDYGLDDSSFSHNAIGKDVQSRTETHQDISPYNVRPCVAKNPVY